jgi:GTP-binding protein LepA
LSSGSASAGDDEKPLKSLIFDSKFDSYKGAIPYIRIFDGRVGKGTNIKMMSSGKVFEITEVGVFTPGMTIVDELRAGQVGYVAGSIKNVGDTRVGDTITNADNPSREPLPGYRKAVSMVFCGLYPVETSDYDRLKDALEKLQFK